MLKATGIVRKVDELGRIVIPIELRRTLKVDIGDPLEIYVDDERIFLKRYQPSCVFCGQVEDVAFFHSKLVCSTCRGELAQIKAQ